MEEKNIDMEVKKSSKLPLIILIVVLVIASCLCGIFIGKSLNKDKDETKTEKKSNVVEKGKDSNTSGRKVIDTITKEVSLNGNNYELKVEVLEGETVIAYSNIYLNGRKFVSDSSINFPGPTVGPDIKKDYYKSLINDMLNDVKILKDLANDDEYLVIVDNLQILHVISLKDGELFKMLYNASNFGFEILTNEIPTISGYHASIDKEYKYGLYGDRLLYVFNDHLLILDLDDVEVEYKNCGKVPLESVKEYKITINNGKVEKVLNKTYNESDGYKFEGSGGCGGEF